MHAHKWGRTSATAFQINVVTCGDQPAGGCSTGMPNSGSGASTMRSGADTSMMLTAVLPADMMTLMT